MLALLDSPALLTLLGSIILAVRSAIELRKLALEAAKVRDDAAAKERVARAEADARSAILEAEADATGQQTHARVLEQLSVERVARTTAEARAHWAEMALERHRSECAACVEMIVGDTPPTKNERSET